MKIKGIVVSIKIKAFEKLNKGKLPSLSQKPRPKFDSLEGTQ